MTYELYTTKVLNYDIGFANCGGSFSCITTKDFGTIYLSKYSDSEPIGMLSVVLSEGVEEVYPQLYIPNAIVGKVIVTSHKPVTETCNVYIYIYKSKSSGKYNHLVLKDSLGNVIYDGLPYLTDTVNINHISGIGVAKSLVRLGSKGYVTLGLNIFKDYYDYQKSTAPPQVDVTYFYRALPVVCSNLRNYWAVAGNINKEVTYTSTWDRTISGYNYISDYEQNARLVITRNNFYGLTNLFKSAKLYINLNGQLYFGADLLSIDTGAGAYVSEPEVLPAGRFTDGAYVLKLYPLTEIDDKQLNVEAHLRFEYETTLPPCTG